jgi:hypothetical protein
MEPPRRGGSTPKHARSLLNRAISNILTALCDACNRNGVKRRPWSGDAPRHSLPSSPFFHACFAPASGTFYPLVAGFLRVVSLSLVAFFIYGVLHAGLGAVELLLAEEPAP